MIGDWKDMITAPQNEPVLICEADCKIQTAIQKDRSTIDDRGREKKIFVWVSYPHELTFYGAGAGAQNNSVNPKYWQPLPLPPKHLYERKLTADLLEKQVKELRGLD